MIGLTREMKIKSILKNHYLLIVLVSSIEIPILTKIKKMNHTMKKLILSYITGMKTGRTTLEKSC